MMLGVTCALFFALAICHLTLYAQLSIGVGLADYCSDPLAAQESSLELPGKSQLSPILDLFFRGKNALLLTIEYESTYRICRYVKRRINLYIHKSLLYLNHIKNFFKLK